MRNEEAINVLSKLRGLNEAAIDLAIESLQLSTKRHPDVIITGGNGGEPKVYWYECPHCGSDVEANASHCDNCYQRLDWTEGAPGLEEERYAAKRDSDFMQDIARGFFGGTF